jgi:DNA-binding NarL/FixJ family response regulator
MRIAVFQGNLEKARQALKDMEMKLYEKDYPLSFFNYDIAIGWYYYILRLPDMLPMWLKDNFVPYGHAYFADNFGNLMKARYHYLTKNYPPLLTYIEEMKQRESILYGRVELLAIEACVYYQKKDKEAAFAALRDAYDTASPNKILMPLIELGKDMRTLAAAAIREPNNNIPLEWLETLRRRSAAYAKYQSLLLSNYAKTSGRNADMVLSGRENDVLLDLYNGLNRPEIAAKKKLSLNTVNSVVTNIFNKLGAHSTVDVIRIATERNLLRKR